MLNFCVFTFILYAVAGSVKKILFGSRKKQCRASFTGTRRQTAESFSVRPKKSGNITSINLKRTSKKAA